MSDTNIPRGLDAVDPEQRPLALQLDGVALNAQTLEGFRTMADGSSMLSLEVPDSVTRSEFTVTTRDGHDLIGYKYEHASPAQTDAGLTPALMSIHGGGLVMGTPITNDVRHLRLCAALGITIFAPSYRKAPEHPYPTPMNDCLDAYGHILSHADQWGLDVAQIALSGDSAGGALAAAMSQVLRDTSGRDKGGRDMGGQSPALLVLVYPMLDARTGDEVAVSAHIGHYVWTRAMNRFGWQSYLGDHPKTAPASPAQCPDLSGLPPTFIATGALDLFQPENIDYAQRLLDAGIDTELLIYPGTIHGFPMLKDIAMTHRLEVDYSAALKRAFGL